MQPLADKCAIAQEGIDGLEQFLDSRAGLRRNAYDPRPCSEHALALDLPVRLRILQQVPLVQDQDLALLPRPQFLEHAIHLLAMDSAVLGRDVDHVQDQRGLGDLLESGSERFEQRGR